jgi:hypothetical protein
MPQALWHDAGIALSQGAMLLSVLGQYGDLDFSFNGVEELVRFGMSRSTSGISCRHA